MSSKAHAERLSKALESTGMCQAVNKAHTDDQIRLLLRIAPGAESAWTQIINQVLTAAEYVDGQAHAFQAHICKNYFRKQVDESQKKLVFGWYISIQSASMTESLDVVIKAIKGSLPEIPASLNEVTEMPLATRAQYLNMPNEKNKGAWTVGGKQDFKMLR